MRSLHDTGDRSALLERIELLSVESAARWGRMNVAQMLRHCAEAMRMATGELPVKPLGPWLLRARAVKYLAFRVPIPKGAPTAPELRVADADVVEFASERTRLQDLVTQFAGLGPAAAAVAHPLFGALTSDEWSRLHYKAPRSPPQAVRGVTPRMDELSDLDKLRFYRDEIKHEFALLAMRSTMLVTCQSFLIVPFGIMNSASSFAWVVVPLCMVAIPGMFVALLLRGPLDAADRTIDKWLQKQRQLLKDRPTLLDLALDRDLIDGTHADSGQDLEHARSLSLSRRAPLAFVAFWMVALVWIVVRALFGPQ